MREEFERAWAIVKRDVENTHGPLASVRDAADVEYGDFTITDPPTVYLSIVPEQPAYAQVVMVADQVQDWAVEELCSMGRSTSWPECPLHRNSHPLEAAADGTRAVWRCLKSGEVIAEIGALIS
jgi:hypothetical protein